MTWFDIYTEFLKNFEKISQLQQDYIRNLERINQLYDDSIKRIERVNEIYNKMATSYEQQFDNIQRMSQKWFDVLSNNSTKMKGSSSKAKG
jgi:uncharacterized protein Yka (UPF0111/DUF47 family)